MRILTIPFIFFCIMVNAQELVHRETSLTGNVITKFSLSNDPTNSEINSGGLANQTIFLFSPSTKTTLKTYTDSQGNYLFDHVDPGEYLLYVKDPVIKWTSPIYLNVLKTNSGTNRIKPLSINRMDHSIEVIKNP